MAFNRDALPEPVLGDGVAPPAISHPFRLVGGDVVTVDDGGIDHAAEAVAVTVLTEKGSRPLVPDFGLTDPTFAALDVAELQAVLRTFGPERVTVALEDSHHPTDSRQALTLTVSIDD